VSTFSHTSVLPAETLAALRPRSGGRYLDGTVGGAGHARAVLEASSPDGFLFGCDRDADAIRAAGGRLVEFNGRFELRLSNYTEAVTWIPAGSLDGVLLDLGVSSHQLDSPGRGFSFQHEGPLDMRMDRRDGPTAADLVNGLPAEELARIFWTLGDERHSRRIARAIEAGRTMRPFTSTLQLAAFIEQLIPRRGARIHPATRVFQALRIAVNDELGEVERGLDAAAKLLAPGGRLVVVAFHSLEDRIVKRFMAGRTGRAGGTSRHDPGALLAQAPAAAFRLLTPRAIRPGAAETDANPRARSSRLRAIERLDPRDAA
jgi:16S rRNA (cytosine1402-N4)-methyltransferase